MAEPIRDYNKLGSDIIRLMGGDDNITFVEHCATRLRLKVKKLPDGALEAVTKLPGVISVAENGGQYQVIIGMHVKDVYAAVAKEFDLENHPRGGEAKESVFNRIIATMSSVFAPFIYILAAAGILQGALIIITIFFPAFAETGTYEVFSFISWAPFTFLPIFIAITASKHFKCNTFIAVACCAALVSPTWAEIAGRIADGETVKFLFFNLSETTYTSSVLPPLILVWIMSYLEKFLNKHMNETIKPLFVPFLCMAIMVPLTIIVLGTLSTMFANGVANGYNYLVAVAPAVAAAIIGGFWQVIVIFGFHWGITPVVLANFEMYGSDSFQAFQTCAVIAQGGAALGVLLKTRNKQFKTVTLSAFITGIFGITEPIIYGVSLRLKKPFICGCIAGAVGAVVTSFFGSKYFVYAGLPGWLTVVNSYSASNPSSLTGEIIGCLIAFLGAAALTYFVGFQDPPEDDLLDEEATAGEVITDNVVKKVTPEHLQAAEHITIKAPIKGEVVELADVPDPVFSSGVMGKGAAINPEEGLAVSPVDGTVVSVFDTKHAIGIATDDGIELLIHIGVDTVNMKGKGFTQKCEVGQKVKAGDPLMEFDIEEIKKAGYSPITPILVTNPDNFLDIMVYPATEVKTGDKLLAVLK